MCGRAADGDRRSPSGLSGELYQWVLDGDGPAPQSPLQVAEALCRVIDQEPAGIAQQSGDAARAHAAGALRDPTRAAELTPLLDAFARTLDRPAR